MRTITKRRMFGARHHLWAWLNNCGQSSIMGSPFSTQSREADEEHSAGEKSQGAAAAAAAHYAKLYDELVAGEGGADGDGAAASAADLFKSRFESYFGGPSGEFGRLLYRKLFGGAGVPVELDLFLSSMTLLGDVESFHNEGHESETFCFSVFSQGAIYVEREGVMKILHAAASMALVVGSELYQRAAVSSDHFLLQSIANAIMLHADKDTGHLHSQQFSLWVKGHCPHLLEGMQQWIGSLLLHTSSASGSREPSPTEPDKLIYQLPKVCLEKGPSSSEEMLKKETDLYMTVWMLSTALPLVYFGHREDGRKKAQHRYPVGGSWSLLYSSREHGFSMNRFQHHCSDYREPSVMLLTCWHPGDKQEHLFAVAADSEWKDGTYFWGRENFRLIQLSPMFEVVIGGPKLLSLNEKQRGFPTGLRVMSSQKYNQCLFHVDSSLEKVTFREGAEMSISLIEVWGCGDVEAVKAQQLVKQREQQEVLRRRKIKASTIKETWEDSPDRYLMEIGGVTTNRPREQQQQ